MVALAWSDVDADVTPAPAWRFTLTLPDVIATADNAGLGATTAGTGSTISFLVERISAVHKGIEYESVPFNSGTRNFPIGQTVDALSFSLMETTAYGAISYMRAWKNMVIDDQGNFGLPATYKMPVTLEGLDETGSTVVTFQWLDCSPTRVESYEFDGSQTGHVSAQVTLAVDNVAVPQVGSGSTPTFTPTSS